jgi:hypothetical protein
MALAISSAVPGRRAGPAGAARSRAAAREGGLSVCVEPGPTALTRTPCGPYSAAHALVSSTRAALPTP